MQGRVAHARDRSRHSSGGTARRRDASCEWAAGRPHNAEDTKRRDAASLQNPAGAGGVPPRREQKQRDTTRHAGADAYRALPARSRSALPSSLSIPSALLKYRSPSFFFLRVRGTEPRTQFCPHTRLKQGGAQPRTVSRTHRGRAARRHGCGGGRCRNSTLSLGGSHVRTRGRRNAQALGRVWQLALTRMLARRRSGSG